ncbi:MAG: beta-mannanase [Thermoleophilia bacterium]|nr:beta-mannanase [Thermoleophilia bacterium]
MRTIALIVVLLALSCCACAADEGALPKLGPPPAGKLYHGVFPGGSSGMEDDITREQVVSYEEAVGQRVAWVYFSHNWYQGTAFPLATCTWIRELGAVPYVRLMLREKKENTPNRFSLEALLAGKLDEDLRAWGKSARDFGAPLLVEFGTEMNGEWFPWNGKHHGAGRTDGFGDPAKPDGPERFAAAYRHIVDTIRGQGAANITWVFHVNASDWPQQRWNRLEHYYPGHEYVDWLAMSAYGPQEPTDDEFETFREQMDPCYHRLQRLAPDKPIIVAEFGCTAGSPAVAPEVWGGAALDDILGGRWPRVIGFSWWNERWSNDDDPAHDTNMRVEDTPDLAAAFSAKLGPAADRLVSRPVKGEG